MNKRVLGGGRPNKINQEITASTVRLFKETGESVGVVSLREALHQAESNELDLVEVNGQVFPPICKIMNYSKFLYEKNRTLKLQKKKHKSAMVKELKLRPVTDVGDFNLKIKQLTKFLEQGSKVKVYVVFRGREITMHQQLGRELLKRVLDAVQEMAIVDAVPSKAEGKQMVMLLSPRKKG